MLHLITFSTLFGLIFGQQTTNFYLVKQVKTYADANAYCQSEFNTKLATIDTVAKQNEIATEQAVAPFVNDAWIGLNDITTEGTFVWEDGNTPYSYNAFGSGEPNNLNNEDCVVNAHNFGWNDASCAATLYFWCAQPPSSDDCDNWIYAAAKGSYGNYDIGGTTFNQEFQDSSHYIIRRECSSCASSHQELYYRRITSGNLFKPYTYLLEYWSDVNNVQGTNFRIYDNFFDAVLDNTANEWGVGTCNYNDFGVGFPRDCGGSGQWNNFYSGAGAGGQADVRFSIYAPGQGSCAAQSCHSDFQDCLPY